MSNRVNWDEYETALLIEGFWDIERNPSNRAKIIKKISDNLRTKAVNEGLDIDDKFRNTNGISLQLVSIGYAFFPNRRACTISTVFKKMVLMFENNKSEFDVILKKLTC